ncbi:M64 family metallopeptidase, partial [Alistipes sp.]|uniref:M64 family metallopeptidase n=1 Tax=Alistipes sp. TaxID=1872444 RepID=UPI003AEFFA70
EDPDPERGALRAIYEAAGGGGWTHNENWCTDKPLGEWYGLETDEEGHVVALSLSRNNLSGTISEKIGKLTKLRHLDLSWNELEGDLTWQDKTDSEIYSLFDKLLELESIDLSHNRLTGEFLPGNFCRMERLQRIDLSSNRLRGYAFPLPWEPLFENGRMVELNLNDNLLHGDVPGFLKNHPEWDRLALGVIRQNRDNLPGIEYDKDIHLPDFTFTDLRDGSQQRIGELVGSNKLTMLLSWDPMQPESTEFMQTTVRRFHTLFGAQGFAVVAITPAGEQYAEEARSYLAGHPLAWPVVTDYADAQGRRTILPAYPYPSYLLVDGDGKLLEDIFTGQYCPTLPMPGENYVFDLKERPFQHNDFLNVLFRNTFGKSSYRSTDYSMDKQYIALQTATRGNGIDIVLAGDAFTDVDIETGYYRQVMEFAMESFFSLEPTKSYREYFNIWMVYAVSKCSYIDTYYSGDNALGTYVGSDGTFNTPITSIKTFIKPNPNAPVVAAIVNGYLGGVTYMKSYANYAFTGYSYGLKNFLANTFIHESAGHGLGLLDDEYVDSEIAEIPESEKKVLKENQNKGRFLNVSLTEDPKAVYWSHLIGHPNYPYVGIHRGGHYYAKGVWRSEYESVMNTTNSYLYFNTISRELIVKRILDLSGEGFTFEKFLEKDSDVGRPTSVSNADRVTRYEAIPYKHHPPILVD